MRGTYTEVLSTIGPFAGLFSGHASPLFVLTPSVAFHTILNLVTVSRVRSTSILNRFQALFV